MKYPLPEQVWDDRLRSIPGLVAALTLGTAALLYAGIWACAVAFDRGWWPVALLSGLLVHAFLLIVVHDGAHRALTGTRADRWIINIGAGFVLLPFWAEPFRSLHLVHHGHTNVPQDPLWPPTKRRLFAERRWLYVLAELVPLLFSVLALVQPPVVVAGQPVRRPAISWPLLALAFVVAGCTAWLLRPAPLFVVATVLATNAWGGLRHLCEHFGTHDRLQSNTFAFPLGMGIGNHAVHHEAPRISWVALAAGLRARPKDSDPWRALVGLLRDPAFHHYLPIADSDVALANANLAVLVGENPAAAVHREPSS